MVTLVVVFILDINTNSQSVECNRSLFYRGMPCWAEASCKTTAQLIFMKLFPQF